MAKKILCGLLLVLALVFALASCDSEDVTENHTSYDAFTFYSKGNGTCLIGIAPAAKYYEEIIIPSTYNGEQVVGIIKDGFRECEKLKTVVIPDTVVEIEPRAFELCANLKSVTFCASVRKIGAGAFYGCESIRDVYFNGTVKDWIYIDFDSILGNYEEFPNRDKSGFKGSANPLSGSACSYFSDGANLYFNGELLKNLVISAGEGSITIDQYAFQGCRSIETVTVSSESIWIRTNAFAKCCNLTSVDLPIKGEIDEGAFESCSALKSIALPKLRSISSDTFSGCTSLESIVIPDGVTDIWSSAFSGCTSLESVVIPDGVTDIWSSAFSGCSSLKSINIPSSVTWIGQNAFEWCCALESITLQNGITKINDYTFSGCSSLENIVLPGALSTIGSHAFDGCTSLESVVIPNSVTSISPNAFSNCTSLTSVIFKNPNGWWCSLPYIPINDTSISSSYLTSASSAATYLTSTYKSYYWYRT